MTLCEAQRKVLRALRHGGTLFRRKRKWHLTAYDVNEVLVAWVAQSLVVNRLVDFSHTTEHRHYYVLNDTGRQEARK